MLDMRRCSITSEHELGRKNIRFESHLQVTSYDSSSPIEFALLYVQTGYVHAVSWNSKQHNSRELPIHKERQTT